LNVKLAIDDYLYDGAFNDSRRQVVINYPSLEGVYANKEDFFIGSVVFAHFARV
jgi:hypothetical protein